MRRKLKHLGAGLLVALTLIMSALSGTTNVFAADEDTMGKAFIEDCDRVGYTELGGGVYALYSDIECTNELARVTTVKGDDVYLGTFPAGMYYLKQIKAPDGYILKSEPSEYEIYAGRNKSTWIMNINAMDMVEGYGDGGNPLIDKSQFVLSLFAQLDNAGIDAQEKSIIDRCVEEVYKDYQKGGKVPTLCVLREKLLEQEEEKAHGLALSLELFTNGSLDAFAHETNVDINNRMVVYDIMDLGEALKTMGLLVITDAMLNRVTENWKKGKRTHIILDEFHVVFENEHSGNFFNSAWRRFRKRNAYPNAITQNVEYLLDSVLASTMLSNSEYIVMLNQAARDREKLANLLNISKEQMSYITDTEAGCGLIKYGSLLVPFVNRFPKDTQLYKLMTTKPGEDTVSRIRE